MNFTNFPDVLDFAHTYSLNPFYALALFTQSRLETGNFTSNLYRNANNAFGMRVAAVRPQLRVGVYNTGTNGVFAKYATVLDSWLDRRDLDQYNHVRVPADHRDIGRYIEDVLNKGYVPAGPERLQYARTWGTLVYDMLNEYQEELGLSEEEMEPLPDTSGGISSPFSSILSRIKTSLLWFVGAVIVGFVGFRWIKKKFL